MNRINTIVQSTFLRIHLPVLLYMGSIFILSSIPTLRPPDLGFEPQDKFYHFVFYAPFGYFVARSFSEQLLLPTVRGKYWFYSILFGVVYGISDEIHQYFVPGRIMSVWDMVADGLGVCLGVILFRYRIEFLTFFSRKHNS